MSTDGPNLRSDDLDRLGKTLLTLASELWVLKDRQKIFEHVLEEQGLNVSDLLEHYQPDAALQKELADARAAFIERILKSLEAANESAGPATAPAPPGTPPQR